MKIKDLDLEDNTSETKKVALRNGKFLTVRNYLPIVNKAELVNYVVQNSIEMRTGRFSPVRVMAYTRLAIVKFYGGVEFDEDKNELDYFDMLQTNGVFGAVVNNMDSQEYAEIMELIENTIQDIADYNSSFAGIVQTATMDAEGLGNQLNNILANIKSEEGQKVMKLVGDMVKSN